MATIKYCDIPQWLHGGQFYRNLSSEDPTDMIDIPADCFTEDNSLAGDGNKDECSRLVRVALFWILDDIPVGVLEFCIRQNFEVFHNSILSVPGAVESKMFDRLLKEQPQEDKVPFDMILKTGKSELILLIARQMKDRRRASAIAAQEGNLSVLEYLHKQGFKWNEETCSKASMNGHLDCLQYARENGCPWDFNVFKEAAQNGHLHIMQYAHQQGLEWQDDVCTDAALKGHLPCLQYAHENGCPWSTNVFFGAAQNGHLNCMQYAHEQGVDWHGDVCSIAAMDGHLHCLQYARENGCPWDYKVYIAAAQNNHLNCMQYAHQHGLTEWHVNVCLVAADRNHLDCLQFAHENGCPWDYRMYEVAACRGDLNIMQYACARGLEEWPKSVCQFAAWNGHLSCLKFAHENGCPWDREAASSAAEHGHVGCLQYLYENGCPWDETTPRTAAQMGQIATLRYAMEHGCPYDNKLLQDVVRSGSVECLQYLVEEAGVWMDDSVFEIAVLKGNLLCVQYLMDQGCPYLIEEYDKETLKVKVCNQVFVKDNPEFTVCVRYAVERGWKADAFFCKYISSRDIECVAYLKSEGLFVK